MCSGLDVIFLAGFDRFSSRLKLYVGRLELLSYFLVVVVSPPTNAFRSFFFRTGSFAPPLIIFL